MPFHERHRQQRGKNLMLLFMLLALIAILYAVTVVRMGNAAF